MVYVTGDCHGDFRKFGTEAFHEQKEMSKDDIVIVCGDFGGVWSWKGESPSEKYWLDWLNNKTFTTVYVEGNHENFDRLNSEFEIVDFCGGKAHKIRDSIYHLIRGEVFIFENKKFFAFGGASSHDIDDGILSWEDFETEDEFIKTWKKWDREQKIFRVNHRSWWSEELPSKEEMKHGFDTLESVNNEVDFVISHCCPSSVASLISHGFYKPDTLTSYFEELSQKVKFQRWFFGHYHDDKNILDRYTLLYDQIVRIL
jgi:hypothetical protein